MKCGDKQHPHPNPLPPWERESEIAVGKIAMNQKSTLDYVNSTAQLLGIPMDAARAERVAAHLQRTVAMAALLDAGDLPVDVELAEIYCPAAYKPNEIGRKQL